jgi:two-component system cell cycle response regulator
MSDSSSASSPLVDMRTRILFVDDSYLMRSAVLEMLGDDFDLVLAEDGQKAWETIVSDKSIKLIFTDLVMPKLDGFEVLNLVRTATDKRIRELPVIVLTAADDSSEAKEKAYRMGATDFVTKPFGAADLKSRAESHLVRISPTDDTTERSELDPLTGLLTRRGILARIEKDISVSIQHKLQLSALHIEIDGFKELFVRIGRGRAELIVEKVARSIADHTRKEDSVSRISLSSFVVSLPATDPDTSLLIARRICRAVKKYKAKLRGKVLPVSVSIGACIIERGTHANANLILEIAGRAKEQAMAKGRNQVFPIDFSAYRRQDHAKDQPEISIDKVLSKLKANGEKVVMAQMDAILDRLLPIFKLMNSTQKLRFLASRSSKRDKGS